MSQSAERRATYQDVLDAPPNVVAEVLHGVLYLSPRPAILHALAASNLGGMLFGCFGIGSRGGGGPGGWLILDEPELHLGDDILVPDLAGWRRERTPDVTAAFATVAPDWVCEVLSPSTQAMDRTDKLDIYLRAGVVHAWLVDPIARMLEVYRVHEPASAEHADAAAQWLRLATFREYVEIRAEPFDAVALALGLLWGDAPADGGGAASGETRETRGETG